jgi:glycerol-3-phosphate acyltransferase PlsY
MQIAVVAGIVVLAYLVGAIPFGYLIVRLTRGVDIRDHGSGNIGATNALRVAGASIGVPVLLLDVAKGAVPVLVAQLVMERTDHATPLLVGVTPILAAVAAILGHMMPIYLHGKGGKGVATALGALLVLAPWSIVAGLGVWILSLLVWRMVSLSSVLAAVVVPIVCWQQALGATSVEVIRAGFVTAIALLVIWKHRGNLARIRRGEEPHLFGPGAQDVAVPKQPPPRRSETSDASE